MSSIAAAVNRFSAAIPLGETAKVALGTSIIVGFSVYTVFGSKPKRVGEDLASSEKPQSMRKGEKMQRSLEAEKKIAAERAAAKAAAFDATTTAKPAAA